MHKKYEPDPFLNGISRIPTTFEKRKMLPDSRNAEGYPWRKIPPMPTNKVPNARRLFAIYFLSNAVGFAAAWFGAATFDHFNLKIDSFRDRLDTVPYK